MGVIQAIDPQKPAHHATAHVDECPCTTHSANSMITMAAQTPEQLLCLSHMFDSKAMSC